MSIVSGTSTAIWAHPGLGVEAKEGDMMSQAASSSAGHHTNENGGNNHHHHGHLVSAARQQLMATWPALSGQVAAASPTTPGSLSKCIMGLHQLRLVEISGFLEKRREPEIVSLEFARLLLLFDL